MGDPGSDPNAAALDAEFLASIAALGRAMQAEFDPRRFLAGFSRRIQSLLPHDRLVVCAFSEDRRTFTIFAEHVGSLGSLHEGHYTTLFTPNGHYVSAEWSFPEVFEGVAVHVDDMRTDPRISHPSAGEAALLALGLRSMLMTPLLGGTQAVGALVATSLTPARYGPEHVRIAQRLAELVAPFVQTAILLHRERDRRRRHAGATKLAHELAETHDLRAVFGQLAKTVKTLVDFEAIGVTLVTPGRRELQSYADIDSHVGNAPLPEILPTEAFSFSETVLGGQTLVIGDAAVELDRARPGDRHVIEDGIRSILLVPLVLGDAVGGALYFGLRRPHAYDAVDREIAESIGPQFALAIEHQRLIVEQLRSVESEKRSNTLARRVAHLEVELDQRFGFGRILGRNTGLREALSRAAKVAPTETTVLVTGESGTGKELVAHAIHVESARAAGPFVAINCAALPEQLLESELFGHEKGAFTGADRAKPGRFEIAAGGTLFLDEVGELAPAVQAKLLRVLQEREYMRVGGSKTMHADVRVIAATNRDLAAEVERKLFRDDLYYRLSVFTVHLPPLRERGDDVLLLAEQFVRQFEEKMGKSVPGLSRDARGALLAHPWPGNIRELSNAVERALILNDGGLITAAQLGLDPAMARGAPEAALRPPARVGEPALLADLERQAVVDALARAKGNKSRAAAILGVTRSQMYTRVKRFGLEP